MLLANQLPDPTSGLRPKYIFSTERPFHMGLDVLLAKNRLYDQKSTNPIFNKAFRLKLLPQFRHHNDFLSSDVLAQFQ